MKELTVQATLENIPLVTAAMDEFLEALECPLKAQMQLDVAVDELFGNIAQYAYPDGTGSVTVRFDHDEAARMVSVTFVDSGVPFDPLAKEDPDVTLPSEQRKVGGLGVFLVKQNMDDIQYEYLNGSNILTLKKEL